MISPLYVFTFGIIVLGGCALMLYVAFLDEPPNDRDDDEED